MMQGSFVALLGIAILVGGCGRAALTDPLVARTGRADANDGYQATLAAVEADGYAIIEDDQAKSFVRVVSKTESKTAPKTANQKRALARRSIDISAWSGSVRLDAGVPAGQALSEAEAVAMREEMKELAWSIASRARILAGEMTVPTSTRPDGTGIDDRWPRGAYYGQPHP